MLDKKTAREAVSWSSAIVMFLLVGILPPGTGCFAWLAAPRSGGTHGPYATRFPHAENPISEGGKWLNGHADGLDWTDVRTTPRFAFGTEIGGRRPAPQKYDDSTAILKGTWGPDQTVEATVHSMNPNQDGKVLEEVELRLRSSISPHNCTGYEVMFRCSKIPRAYCNIARWEGPLGRFTMLKETYGSAYGVKDGDVVKATMIGKVLTVYINGAQMIQLSDDRFTNGNPGIGYYLEGATGVMRDFGFSSFMATDR
ncbi:MAG TPA: hypothetical protein VMI94_01465 [Bryobacteraceae bacterium]|nr:hypothetical protein [Bryobacteraceae bacterium]